MKGPTNKRKGGRKFQLKPESMTVEKRHAISRMIHEQRRSHALPHRGMRKALLRRAIELDNVAGQGNMKTTMPYSIHMSEELQKGREKIKELEQEFAQMKADSILLENLQEQIIHSDSPLVISEEENRKALDAAALIHRVLGQKS